MCHLADLYVFGTNRIFCNLRVLYERGYLRRTASAYGVMIPLDIAAFITAWVLAIIARVMYKNRFSLVLLIIYGSLLALSVIGFGVLILIMLGLF